MKTVPQKHLYKDLFSSWENVLEEFTGPSTEARHPTRVWASYSYEDYSGDAAVVFRRGRKVFVQDGGHCSCYGLEGQWGPTEYASIAEFELCARKETYGLIHGNLDEILATLRA